MGIFTSLFGRPRHSEFEVKAKAWAAVQAYQKKNFSFAALSVTEFLENGGGLPAVKLPENFGIDAEDFKLLQRLQYDAVLPPFKLEM